MPSALDRTKISDLDDATTETIGLNTSTIVLIEKQSVEWDELIAKEIKKRFSFCSSFYSSLGQ